MKDLLTLDQSRQLAKLEKIIKLGKETFVEVGSALAEIRRGKLYKADFDTFEKYCREKWGWTRVRAYQLIEAAGVHESLPENVNNCLQTESQARELSKVPEDKREEVLEVAQANGGTAKAIKEAASEVCPPDERPCVVAHTEVMPKTDDANLKAAFGGTIPPIPEYEPAKLSFADEFDEWLTHYLFNGTVKQLNELRAALKQGIEKIDGQVLKLINQKKQL